MQVPEPAAGRAISTSMLGHASRYGIQTAEIDVLSSFSLQLYRFVTPMFRKTRHFYGPTCQVRKQIILGTRKLHVGNIPILVYHWCNNFMTRLNRGPQLKYVTYEFKLWASTTVSMMCSAIAIEEVAPGDGALRIKVARPIFSMTKSSTSCPSESIACARIPRVIGRD